MAEQARTLQRSRSGVDAKVVDLGSTTVSGTWRVLGIVAGAVLFTAALFLDQRIASLGLLVVVVEQLWQLLRAPLRFVVSPNEVEIKKLFVPAKRFPRGSLRFERVHSQLHV